MPSEPQHYASVQVTSRARRGSGAGGLIRSSSRPAANPQPSRGMQLPLDAMPHRQELGGHPPLGGHRAVRSAGLSCARSERRPLLLSGVLTWRAHPSSQHRDRDGGMQPQLVPNAPHRNPCKSSARLDLLAPSFDPCNKRLLACTQLVAAFIQRLNDMKPG
ncbi:uncharacterized protein PSANT_02462 [Moesziomyces antarcticus]|uniref:Uncharacterized protein n=1 Tax=Pseudozyma antarctica TaxID=84753 RepID=A0A5C3FKR3_PSEA2|nr:uncharacterized protein PSANT_02462 [Moesziomyces antarcticus]